MTYRQITSGERYTLGRLHAQGVKLADIARVLERHPSTIGRELQRNRDAYDGAYRPERAQEHADARRSRSRRNTRFGGEQLKVVEHFIRQKWSPKQISGELRRQQVLSISHETIYRHVWENKRHGGLLYKDLRYSVKRRRKRYGRNDSRGRLAGKKHISERPREAEARQEIGHWEMDTVMGHGSKDCILTLVERVTGFVLIGKLADRTSAVATKRAIQLILSHRSLFKTITADNGTEFHDYKQIEEATGVPIYFATPYHSWERGTNENTNGLIRQYLPKRLTMHGVTQRHCSHIAGELNTRPRERHSFASPLEKICER